MAEWIGGRGGARLDAETADRLRVAWLSLPVDAAPGHPAWDAVSEILDEIHRDPPRDSGQRQALARAMYAAMLGVPERLERELRTAGIV